jgi:hypothetical protein
VEDVTCVSSDPDATCGEWVATDFSSSPAEAICADPYVDNINFFLKLTLFVCSHDCDIVGDYLYCDTALGGGGSSSSSSSSSTGSTSTSSSGTGSTGTSSSGTSSSGTGSSGSGSGDSTSSTGTTSGGGGDGDAFVWDTDYMVIQ